MVITYFKIKVDRIPETRRYKQCVCGGRGGECGQKRGPEGPNAAEDRDR